tara:strand:- start:572 stop:673 length:102 start_codon:yes stop_codon:yes gene_type:complete
MVVAEAEVEVLVGLAVLVQTQVLIITMRVLNPR